MQKLANDNSARRIHFHDPDAPAATVVAPSVFVAVRNDRGKLLLVRRCDSGTWELPGGRVDVGESAVEAAVRQQFVVCFHGRALWGRPYPDLHETSDAAWFDLADVAALPVQPAARLLIVHALSGADEPHLG